jgi:pimeloyl-ACP methyl ester carboxylesterase
MPHIIKGDMQLEYMTFGNPADRPLLLIAGLGDQLIHWDEAFCEDLAGRGCFVVVFDNRDAGLSAKCTSPYTIADMAEDAVIVLDGLGIDRAHVCGASMGGMIAQTVALNHSSRVLTLTLIYTTSGRRDLPAPDPDVLELLIAPAPSDRDGYIDYYVKLHRALSGKGFDFDEEWTRTIVSRAHDRSYFPEGISRQMAAIQAQQDRRSQLASLAVPVLVIQGNDDPLIPVEAAVDLAGIIPGAELMIIDGMGHDLPHGGPWPRIAEAIARHTNDNPR